MRGGLSPQNLLLAITLLCAYVALSAARGVAATLPQLPGATLTVKLAGTGSGTVTSSDGYISCGQYCVHIYQQPSSVTLTATPASGSSFGGWSGPCSTATMTCTFTPTGDETVSATFTKGSSGSPPPPPVCTARLASRHVLLKTPKHHAPGAKPSAGALRLKLTCDQAVSATLRLAVTETVSKGHAKTFTMTRTVHLAARHAKQLIVKLPAGALIGLGKRRRESLSGALSAKNANGTDKAKLKTARLVGTG